MADQIRCIPCGDRALLLYLGQDIHPELNRRVHALARALRKKKHPAVVEITPSYHCLLIEYDPVRIRMDQVEEMGCQAAESLDAFLSEDSGGQRIEIPVLYGGKFGPDIGAVAEHTGLSLSSVVERHTTPDYRAYCVGFSPGFSYLGGLDPVLNTPRLDRPRTQVPTGSVAIGGMQTGVYPAATPGGWNVIGQTPLVLFDPYRDPPSLINPGDSVRFVPIDSTRLHNLQAATAAPSQRPESPKYQEGQTGLRVIQPGMATTVQDLGRRGYLSRGVPLAGAADFRALMIGNWMLGNRARTAALEITMIGPEVEFTGPIAFCLTGASLPARLVPADGGSPWLVPSGTAIVVGPGDRLQTGTIAEGCRAYLCVAGGFDLPPVLGSLSEDLFAKVGPFGRILAPGDWLPTGLPLHSPADLGGRNLPQDALIPAQNQAVIRVTRGPQAEAFTSAGLAAFFGGEYSVESQSDRQGLRLNGPRITHSNGADILSEPIPAGSIQVPVNGQPILCMNNRQTHGGYTKIAVVVYPDVAVAGQLRPGAKIQFQEVDFAEAHAIAWAERRRLAQIRRYFERAVGFTNQVKESFLALPDLHTPLQIQSRTTPELHLRHFRISVGGITFNADVEEVE